MELNVTFSEKDGSFDVGMAGTSVEIDVDLENTGEDILVAFEQNDQEFGASFDGETGTFPVELEEVRRVEVPVPGGTTDHNLLKNRGAADQHPMSAITGLEKALEDKQPAGNYLTKETDPTVPAWAKRPEKPSYTADEIGADPSGAAASALKTAQEYADKQIAAIPTPDVSGQINTHNTAADAHNDLRLLIGGLTERLNALANSDDTTLDQMAEVVAYIKDNRELIEQVTTGKVSVSDIVDNLTTNVPNKPLSAAQGVALKGLVDSLSESLGGKLDASALTEAVNIALARAKESGEFDGKTPLRGIDYWTAADVQAMVEEAVAEVMKAIAPSKVNFNDGRFFAPATNVLYHPTKVADDGVTFQYKGGSGVEELYFPIVGLYPGRTYTIVFDETYNGGFIQDTYRYGCGVIQKAEYDSLTKPTTQAKPGWVVWHTGSTGKQSGAITFTANADTVYWGWSLGRLSDGKEVTIDMNARVF